MTIMRTTLQICLRFLLWSLIAVTSLIAFCFFLLRNDLGHQQLPMIITAIVQFTTDYSVSIDTITGDIDKKFTINSLIVKDYRGPWLRLNDIQISWNSKQMIHGIIDMDTITIAKIHYLRNPESNRKGWPDLEEMIPTYPAFIHINQIHIDHITSGEEHDPHPYIYSLSGHLNSSQHTTEILLKSTEGPDSTATIKARHHDTTLSIETSGHINHQTHWAGKAIIDITQKRPAINMAIQLESSLPHLGLNRINMETIITSDQNLMKLKNTLYLNQKESALFHLSLPWMFTHKTSIMANWNADLSVISQMLHDPVYRFSGNLGGYVTLSQLHKTTPHLQGNLQLQKGSFQNITDSISVQNIYMHAESNGTAFKINRFEATDQTKGKMTAQGQIDFTTLLNPRISLDTHLRDMHFLKQKHLNGRLDGSLHLGGPIQDLLIDGTLQSQDMHILIPNHFDKNIPTVEVIEIEDTATDPNKRMASKWINGRLDIRIKFGEKTYLNGYGLDTMLDGDLSVTGPFDDYKISGIVQTRKGKFSLFGKQLLIDRGNVTFENDHIILDVLAHMRTRHSDVRVGITGNLDNLSMDFFSDQSLPREEIISHILFGKDTSSITPMQTLQLASALGELTNQRSKFNLNVIENIKSKIGLDHIAVGSDNEETSNMSLEVGKNITDTVYIELGSDLAGESTYAAIQTDITPKLKLEAKREVKEMEENVSIGLRYDY